MKSMWKDPGNQSYLWSMLSSVMAWLGDQNNLMLLSIAIGIVTALVNAYSKCSEGRMLKREEERKEERHRLEMARLRKGLNDETL